MGVFEIILIVACAALVIGVTVATIIRKKQGKSSCDCGCDCCQYHCSCNKKKQDEKDKS